MSQSLQLLLVFTLAALPLSFADSPCVTVVPPYFLDPAGSTFLPNNVDAIIGIGVVPCATAGPPVVVDQGTMASHKNMPAIIGGSVAGVAAVAAGIGGLVAWEQQQNNATRRRRKESGSEGEGVGGGGAGGNSDGGSGSGSAGDNFCKPFTTQSSCPTPGCAWDALGAKCQLVRCTSFKTQFSCPLPGCSWNAIGAKCQQDTCTPFMTQQTCPLTGCAWDAVGAKCRQDTCTPFTTRSTCPLAGCEWDATESKCRMGFVPSFKGRVVVPSIEGRMVVDGNTTAALPSTALLPSSGSLPASSAKPWLWVVLAMLLCGLAICLAALLVCFCGSAKKEKKLQRNMLAAAAVEPTPEPEASELVPFMETPQFLSFGVPPSEVTPQFLSFGDPPSEVMAPPVYPTAASRSTIVWPAAFAVPVYSKHESFASGTTANVAPVMYASPVYEAAAPVMYETAVAAPIIWEAAPGFGTSYVVR